MSLLTTYKDVYFSEEKLTNLEEIRPVYSVHALNYMLKTRSRILKNNAKLAKDPENSEINVRDQGLCRPKIVIVVPFKESARKVVDIMGKLLFGQVKGGNVSNKKRFDEEFGTEPKDLDKIKVCNSYPALSHICFVKISLVDKAMKTSLQKKILNSFFKLEQLNCNNSW